jgi:hypothetical protein
MAATHRLSGGSIGRPGLGALRAAVLAGAAPAVMRRLTVTDDLTAGRLRDITVPGLDLRRQFRTIRQADFCRSVSFRVYGGCIAGNATAAVADRREALSARPQGVGP